MASMKGHHEAVRLLLAGGADVEAVGAVRGREEERETGRMREDSNLAVRGTRPLDRSVSAAPWRAAVRLRASIRAGLRIRVVRAAVCLGYIYI
jgi:hypothetical protein